MADSIYEDGRRYDCLWAGSEADIAFWIDRLEEFGGPVLELACGTGKYLIPATAAGLDIFGLDLSEAMLAEARRKIGNISASKLVLGDMRHFTFNKKFRSVLIAGNSLCQAILREKATHRNLSLVRLGQLHGQPALGGIPPGRCGTVARSAKCR